MGRRLDLHHQLRTVFEQATGLRNSDDHVKFQPPASYRMSYPFIRYKLIDMPPEFAGNLPYKIEHCYELTVIDSDPVSPLREAIAKLKTCRFVRSFESDNLHHYVFHIYD